MKKYINRGLWFFGAAIFLSLGACSDDIDPEIKQLEFERAFSPTSFDVRILNQTTARFNWSSKNAATDFVLELSKDSLEFASIIDTYEVNIEDLPFEMLLEGETRYSARVRAKGLDGLADSNWTPITFTTGPGQILLPRQEGDITHNSIVVRWPAGASVTHIFAVVGTTVVRHDLSADEIEAGVALVAGLNSETEYQIRLMDGLKTQGTATITTFIDLGGAIAVYPEEDLKAIIEAAEDGVTLALFPGEYLVGTGSVDITKNISIVAVYPTDMPVLHSRFILSGTGNLNFSIKDVILSGFTVVEGAVSETRDTYVLDLLNGAEFGTVRLTNVQVLDFQRSLLRGTSGGGDIQNFIVENSLVYRTTDGNNEFIDLRSGRVHNITLVNSTFAEVASTRVFLRADDIAGFSGQKVVIENCTFYKAALPSGRWLYVRTAAPIVTVRKNIFVNLGTGDNLVGDSPVINDNNYVEAAAISGFDSSAKSYDPAFVNAEEFDFTVQEEEIIFGAYGDPRWR